MLGTDARAARCRAPRVRRGRARGANQAGRASSAPGQRGWSTSKPRGPPQRLRSATSWTELRRDALAAESHNLLHPSEPAWVPYVTSVLSDAPGPAVAVSDWMRAVPDQIARWVPGPYTSLGTDGFGFSDTRPAARRFFHVDAESITLAVLSELAHSGAADRSLPAQAIARYKLDLPVSEGLG